MQEYPDGVRAWRNAAGQYHRLEGPAIEWPGGAYEWWRDGVPHREDGPAVADPEGGLKIWFLDGVELTEEEFNARRENRGS